MRFNPHPYQQRAIDFVEATPYCMLFLDMGLGKSVITLTAFYNLWEDMAAERALVVAPKSVAEATWTDEAEKWIHLKALRVSRIIGTAKQRLKALAADADIYVISRDNLVWLVKELKRDLTRFDTLILDELTSFKNPQAQRFKAVRAVRGQFSRIIGLTGTPAPNGYLDLWAQVYCIDGGERLGHAITHFRERYFIVENPYVTWPTYILAPGAQTTIEEKLSDIALSMRAEDYLTLPDRININTPVYLGKENLQRYQEFEKHQVLEFLASLEEASTSPRALPSGSPEGPSKSIYATNAAALASKLMQFANGAIYDDEHCIHPIHDAKITALRDIIEAAQSPVLVFYAFQHDAGRIIEALPAALRVRKYASAADLEAWNAGEIDVLLAHPASTAYGLNMQAGGHIIVWFGLTWNLEHYQQANARLHRQGQQQPVRVYHLVAQDTIDERACRALTLKASNQNHLLDAIKDLVEKYNH